MATINFDRVTLYGNINQERVVDIERKYGRRVRVQFDQQDYLFFLESCDPDLTVATLMREFGLIASRDYLADCERRVLAYGGAE